MKLPSGEDVIVIEGRPVQRIGYTNMHSAPHDQWNDGLPTFDTGNGTGPPEQRVREQDQDGIDAEVLFTNEGKYPAFWRGVKDDPAYVALIHGYNEFLIDEYAAAAPDRLIVMGLIPPTNIDDAVAELEYCAEAGFKGVCMYRFPNGRGYPTPEDDRFWKLALDLEMPISCHSTRFGRDDRGFAYPYSSDLVLDHEPIDMILRFGSNTPFIAMQLAYMGVFDRFPSLRIYFAETQIGWLPHTMIQLDDNYMRYRSYHRHFYGLDFLQRMPSEYIRTHCLWGFLGDPLGVRDRHEIGLGNVIWGSDFAHAASDWPNSRKLIDKTFVSVPEDERYQLLAGNAVAFFGLERGERGTDAGLRSVAPKLNESALR